MAVLITITDIQVEKAYSVWAEEREDGTTAIFARISFTFTGGETQGFKASDSVELSGAARTRAIILFDDIKTAVKAQRAIA